METIAIFGASCAVSFAIVYGIAFIRTIRRFDALQRQLDDLKRELEEMKRKE